MQADLERFTQSFNKSCIDPKLTRLYRLLSFTTSSFSLTLDSQEPTRHPENILYLCTTVSSFTFINAVSVSWNEWSFYYDLAVLLPEGKGFLRKLILNAILAIETEGVGSNVPLAWSVAQSPSYSCSPSSKTIGNAFGGRSSFWCVFEPESGGGPYGSPGVDPRPVHSHIHIHRLWKP